MILDGWEKKYWGEKNQAVKKKALVEAIKSAIPWLDRGCKLGNKYACTWEGKLYNNPVIGDKEKAKALLEQACDDGDDDACSYYNSHFSTEE
jgi:hypothetical protein